MPGCTNNISISDLATSCCNMLVRVLFVVGAQVAELLQWRMILKSVANVIKLEISHT